MARDLQLRCFCSRAPLLAVCGRSEDGEPYVWIKVFKQGRIYGEVVIISGEFQMRCRECKRWHRVTIRRERVDFQERELPPSINLD